MSADTAETLIPFDTTQITSPTNHSSLRAGDPCHPLAAESHPPAVAYSTSGQSYWRDGIGPLPARSHKDAENGVVIGLMPRRGHAESGDVAPTLNTGNGGSGAPGVARSTGVRRLTPRECERLQGFPDDWTTGQSDSARYRQLGNAVAVPVAEWIGRRILAVLGAAGG